MTTLSEKDLRAALDFVGEAHSFEDLDSFRSGSLPGLAQMVPADLVGYNEVDPGNGDALVVTYPELPIDTGETLSRLAHQHPLITLQAHDGEQGAHKISDFLSSRESTRSSCTTSSTACSAPRTRSRSGCPARW